MSIIKRIWAREVYTSQAWPTIECSIELDTGFIVTASIPSGTSRSMYEAYELSDGGTRLGGRGKLSALEMIEEHIAPLLVGLEPNVLEADRAMLALDGTDELMKLGGNTILAVSMAICRAQAIVQGMELFELIAHLSHADSVSLPFPLFNMINGGMHAQGGAAIQEILAIPANASHFQHALEAGVMLYHTIAEVLAEEGIPAVTGAEGGFVPLGLSDDEAIELLARAAIRTEQRYGYSYMISLDVAAQELYDTASGGYRLSQGLVSRDELLAWYQSLCRRYRMYSIEDPFHPYDTEGWQAVVKACGESVAIVGDDLCASHSQRITKAVTHHEATACIIKPNQVGTITHTLQAIATAKQLNAGVIVSHRSGETNDSFIADLAVGASAGHIKAGAPVHGERLAKYHRILSIEQMLMEALEDAD